MALQDFIKKLDEREDTDVVYSKQPETVTKIIPPSNSKVSKVDINDKTVVLPPKGEPITIKFTNFKITKTNNNTDNTVSNKVKSFNIKKVETKKEEEPVVKESKPSEEDIAERLFKESGTEENRKQMWLDNYNAALKSKKTDLTTSMIRKGKFMIYTGNGKNELVLLPETYIVSDKSSKNILSDKWI